MNESRMYDAMAALLARSGSRLSAISEARRLASVSQTEDIRERWDAVANRLERML